VGQILKAMEYFVLFLYFLVWYMVRRLPHFKFFISSSFDSDGMQLYQIGLLEKMMVLFLCHWGQQYHAEAFHLF
jgi:hypothetical protein